MSGPDRIWAWPRIVWKTDGGTWSDHELPRSTEYIRRDPAVLAAQIFGAASKIVSQRHEICLHN